ncbi:MAG: RIO1 family regulatory kinase/ATPase [Deinococcales bacterium]
MSNYLDYDELYDNRDELFQDRKGRRKPKGKRALTAKTQDSEETFKDASLEYLYANAFINELLGEIKSGKEATVYLAKGPNGLMAAKVYRDIAARSFKKDATYKLGRYLSHSRRKRISHISAKLGLELDLALWVQHEYDQLWQLYEAGLPVPKPMLGPQVSELALAGRVVLMEYLGDEQTGVSPRLAEAVLTQEELEAAFEDSVRLLQALFKLGKVHGDYSAFNLLWHQQKIILIDLPQMVNIEENSEALKLLEQDTRSLCASFKSMGLEHNPEDIFKLVIGQT